MLCDPAAIVKSESDVFWLGVYMKKTLIDFCLPRVVVVCADT